jgi:hypothetical protein
MGRVERRKEVRFPKQEPVRIAALAASGSEAHHGTLVESAGSTIKVATSAPVECGSMLKIEGRDFLLLGEVCRVQPSDSGFDVAIRIAHALTGLAELQRMNAAILGRESRTTEKETVTS